MGRSLDEVIGSLPKKRQVRIEALAEGKIRDMLAEARTLTDIRNAVGKTQVSVAKELGIGQNAVSQLEQRSDTYVSTLRRFLQTLGMELELSVVTREGVRYELNSFHPWQEAEAIAEAATEGRSSKSIAQFSGTERRQDAGKKVAAKSTRASGAKQPAAVAMKKQAV